MQAVEPVSRGRAKRVTLADVAAKADVSVATASVAITGRPSGNCRVSPAVAEKIRAAARELNYRPNLQARNLSTRRTRTVALLVKQSSWHVAVPFLAAAQQELRLHGYNEFFVVNPGDHLDIERQQLEACIDRNVEGIMLVPVLDQQGRSNVELLNHILQEEGIPVVQVGIGIPGCPAPVVRTDLVEAFRKGVTLLHAMGHTRIAHVTLGPYKEMGPNNSLARAHLRYTGYAKGMAELGLEPVVFSGKESSLDANELYASALKMAARVAAANPRPTAISSFSDHSAMGLLAGLSEAGVNVPRDISVLGYGNEFFGEMVRPALTTIAPDLPRVGRLATQTLLGMIDGREGASAMVPPTLVMRQSVRQLTRAASR